MPITARSSFTITKWEPGPSESPEDRPVHSTAHVEKSFSGDLTGTSVAQVLMCVADPEDYAAGAGYIASDRVTGDLGGAEGSFVMQHQGLSGGGEASRTWGHIVPGTGTGGLAGLMGTVEIANTPEDGHTITLIYELPRKKS